MSQKSKSTTETKMSKINKTLILVGLEIGRRAAEPLIDEVIELKDKLSEKAFEELLPEIIEKARTTGADSAAILRDYFGDLSKNLQPESTSKPKKKAKKQKVKKKQKTKVPAGFVKNRKKAEKQARKENKVREQAEKKKAKAEKKRKKQRSKNAAKNVKSAMDKKSKNDRYPLLMLNIEEIKSQYDSCHPAAFRVRGCKKLFKPGHHHEAMIIFAHAKRTRLSFDQTIDLFEEMKTEVLMNPNGKNHGALRAFLETNITPSDKHDLDRTVVFPSRSRVLY